MRLQLQIAANTAIQLIGKFATAGLTLVITILLAREYGSSGFGEFTKMTTYIAVFYLVADFGINAIYIKETTIHFTNLLFLRALWSVVLMFAACALLVFLPYDNVTHQGFPSIVKLGIIFLTPTILFQAIFTSCNALFQKNLRYDKSVIASTISTVVTLMFIYLFIAVHLPITVTVLAYGIGSLVLVVLGLFFIKPYISKENVIRELITGNNIAIWKRLFIRSLPLGLTLILNLIYFRADIFIMSYLRPTAEVGIYGLAYKFFDFPLAIPTFFMNAVYPVLLKSNIKSQTRLQLPEQSSGGQVSKIIRKSLFFLAGVSILVTICGLLAAPLIGLVKPEFIDSIVPFRILIVSLPFFFISNVYMWALIALGNRWSLLKIYGIGMVFNIVTNLLFIPQFGYYAAAVITGVSELLVLLLLVRSYHAAMLKKHDMLDGSS